MKAQYSSTRVLNTRLIGRDPSAARPVFVGLLNPNSQSGVFVNSAPLTGWEDTSRDKLLDLLASSLYAGGGGHSVFSKTIGAGLAYSNGLGNRLGDGRVGYYAERTPELPQTMKFVVTELQKTKPDESLVDYAIALAFGGTRSASAYETRGEAMAANLADGLTPHYHQALPAGPRAAHHAESGYRAASTDGARWRRCCPAWAARHRGRGRTYFVIGPASVRGGRSTDRRGSSTRYRPYRGTSGRVE